MVYVIKRKQTFLLLFAIACQILIAAPAFASALDGYWQYSIEDQYDPDGKEKNVADVNNEKKPLKAPGKDASNQEIADYIRDSLNSNSPLPDSIQIKGRKSNGDGTYNIAVRYDNGESKHEYVVKMDAAGVAASNLFSNDEDTKKIQEVYDSIVYGGENEMNEKELRDTNRYLHETEDFIGNMADALGISYKTAASTAAAAVSLAGMAILGAGGGYEKKRDNINAARDLIRQRKAEEEAARKRAAAVAKQDAFREQSKPAPIPSSGWDFHTTGVFENCLSDFQYNGMTQGTRNFLNALTRRFYEATGVTVSLTSGYRPDDLDSYHSDGIAFDVCADEFENNGGNDTYTGKELRDIYCQMASEMGGTPLDEYPGEEGAVHAHGSNIHVSVHNHLDCL